jgi:two-component system, NarL family, sensor histidine kinase UhpB
LLRFLPPFARIGWFQFPAFILIQQSLLLANDLITAAVLFGQCWIGRTRALNVLAGGYLLQG